jgi:prepilin-type N-terminal cleavage/methylation domain-containing protein
MLKEIRQQYREEFPASFFRQTFSCFPGSSVRKAAQAEGESVMRFRRTGFTLIELLVVIAIIAILVAMLLPAVQQVREAARKTQCSDHLHNLAIAIHNYEATHRTLPFAWMINTDLNVSPYGIQLLPFIEQKPLWDKWDSRAPAFNEAVAMFPPASVQGNLEVIATPLEIFTCPSTPGAEKGDYGLPANAGGPGVPPVNLSWTAARSDYCATTGVLGPFAQIAYSGNPGGNRDGAMANVGPGSLGGKAITRMANITDGTANTALLGERVGGPVIYRKGQIDNTLTTAAGMAQGGAWGDFLNGEHWLGGALYDGTPGGGPCGINCTNARGSGFMSFHPGGCQFAMADGVVKFISENVAAQILAGIITCSKGEVIGKF